MFRYQSVLQATLYGKDQELDCLALKKIIIHVSKKEGWDEKGEKEETTQKQRKEEQENK